MLDSSDRHNIKGEQETDANFSGAVTLGNVGVLNTFSVPINPATEETLVDIKNQIGQAGGTPKTLIGTAVAASLEVPFGGTSESVIIRNLSTNGDLLYSWDDSVWGTLQKGGVVGDIWRTTKIYLKRSGAVDVPFNIDIALMA